MANRETLKKLALLKLIITFAITADPWEGLVPAGNHYIVGDSRGRMLRVAFRSALRQKDFTLESNEFKANYATVNFFEPAKAGEQVLRLYEGDKTKKEWTGELTQDFDLTLSINPFMVSVKELMHFKFVAKKSIEPFDGCVVLKGGLPYGDKDPLYQAKPSQNLNSYCVALKFRGQWVVGFNWEGLGYVVFSVMRIIFSLIALGMIFVRPFFPEYSKLKFIWIGNTMFLFQLLMYSPLTTGSFGGVIDELHKGMIRASRRVFFFMPQPKFSDEFLTYANGFQVYKYYDFGLYAAYTEELFIGTIGLFLALIVSGIVKLTKNKRLQKITREMRSATGIVFFIPFSVYTFFILFVYSITSKITYVWCVINTLILIIFLLYYIIQVFRMVTTVANINYLHGRGVYQEGKVEVEQGSDWAFDTFPSMNTRVWMRVLEFLIYINIGVWYVTTYEWGVFAPFAILVNWIILAWFSIHKIVKFESGTDERESILRVAKLTPIITVLRCIEYLILGLLNAIRFKLGMIKFLTIVYLIVFLVDIVLILVQLGLRAYSLTTKPDYIVDMERDRKQKRQLARYHEAQRREAEKNKEQATVENKIEQVESGNNN